MQTSPTTQAGLSSACLSKYSSSEQKKDSSNFEEGGLKKKVKMKKRYVKLSGKRRFRCSIYYLKVKLLMYDTNDRTIESVFSMERTMQVSSIEFWWRENEMVDGYQELHSHSEAFQDRQDWERGLMMSFWRCSSDDLVVFLPLILLLKGFKLNVFLNTQSLLSLFCFHFTPIYSLGSHLLLELAIEANGPEVSWYAAWAY